MAPEDPWTWRGLMLRNMRENSHNVSPAVFFLFPDSPSPSNCMNDTQVCSTELSTRRI